MVAADSRQVRKTRRWVEGHSRHFRRYGWAYATLCPLELWAFADVSTRLLGAANIAGISGSNFGKFAVDGKFSGRSHRKLELCRRWYCDPFAARDGSLELASAAVSDVFWDFFC